jgi:hypothetical protein
MDTELLVSESTLVATVEVAAAPLIESVPEEPSPEAAALEEALDLATCHLTERFKKLEALPQRTTVTPDDPYFGLLSNPPGKWGMVAHGLDKTLVLQGDWPFLDKALNFLRSYATGRMEDDPRSKDIELTVTSPDEAKRVMVTISLARLTRALRLWFYGQLFPTRANMKPVLDEEGEVVDYLLTNDKAIETEAASLAQSFITLINGDSLGAHIGADEEDPQLVGYGVGEVRDGAGGEE